MNKLSDKELLKRFRKTGSSEQAFRLLLERYQERLYWVIRRIVLVHEDADDVLQNTFVKVWKGLPSFRADAQLYTWMYRIAVNEAITHKKKSANRLAASSQEEEEHRLEGLRADPYFDGDEVQLRLIRALESLPTRQREVFELKYFQEMKYEEMAEVLQTSVGALKSSYHHAVKKIEEYVLKED